MQELIRKTYLGNHEIQMFLPNLYLNFIILVLDGVLLLENPKGDNTLNLTGLVDAVSCIFGLKNSKLTVFNGKTGKWSMTREIESLFSGS